MILVDYRFLRLNMIGVLWWLWNSWVVCNVVSLVGGKYSSGNFVCCVFKIWYAIIWIASGTPPENRNIMETHHQLLHQTKCDQVTKVQHRSWNPGIWLNDDLSWVIQSPFIRFLNPEKCYDKQHIEHQDSLMSGSHADLNALEYRVGSERSVFDTQSERT